MKVLSLSVIRSWTDLFRSEANRHLRHPSPLRFKSQRRGESIHVKALKLKPITISDQSITVFLLLTAGVKMATPSLIPPISGHTQFDYFCFDPQIDYAQVLAEAQRQQEGEEESSLSHLKAPLDQLQKSPEDLKKRKSWKSSLFFWRTSSQKKNSRAIPVLKSRTKPIYMNDIAPSYRSGRSTSLAAMFSAMQRSKVDVPYLPVVHHGHSNGRVSLSRPIYLVT